MTSNDFFNVVAHGLAAAAIIVVPLLMAYTPVSWQAMTVAGILGAGLKLAHIYLNK
jgi:phosphate/sulfate permease